MARIIEAFAQFFDGEGNPLINGNLKFLVSGTNNTDKDTYADISEETPNTNPVILDAEGRCGNVFGQGSYRVISYTSDMQQIQQFDPVGVSTDSQLSDWNSATIYSEGFVVVGDDGNYYTSLENNNQGNDPTTDPTNWEQVEFVRYYNASAVYDQYDRVRTDVGTIYISNVDSNQGNTPSTSPTEWSEDPLFTITGEAGKYVKVDSGGDITGQLPIANFNNGSAASGSTYWRGDGVWGTPAGAGNVSGPATSTDNAISRFDSTSGEVIQNSLVTISDTGNIELINAALVRGRNNADTEDINIARVSSTDAVRIGGTASSPCTEIYASNQLMLEIDTGFSEFINTIVLQNLKVLAAWNAAKTTRIQLTGVNGSDEIIFGGTSASPNTKIYGSNTLAITITPSAATFAIPIEGTTDGNVKPTGTPVVNDFAKFTDATTVEGRSYAETISDLGVQKLPNYYTDRPGGTVALSSTAAEISSVDIGTVTAGDVITLSVSYTAGSTNLDWLKTLFIIKSGTATVSFNGDITDSTVSDLKIVNATASISLANLCSVNVEIITGGTCVLQVKSETSSGDTATASLVSMSAMVLKQ